MLKIVVLSLIIFVTGCATNSLAPTPVTQSDLSATQGILVGSFSRDPSGPNYYSQTFRFKNVLTDEDHRITSQPTFNMFTGKTPDDFRTPNSNGGVFVFSLPAGEYIFHNFRLYQSNGYFEQNWTSKEPYAIPFVVQPNKVNYVGEIKLIPHTGKNFFGMQIHAGGIWVINEQWDRDIEVLSRKHPEIPLEEIVNVIPNKKDIFTPLVVLPSETEEFNK